MLKRVRKKATSRFNSRLFETLEARQLLDATPVISEFMAFNDSTIADEDGEFSDWLELTNTGSDPINLSGYWLTDDANDLSKWRFPDVAIDSGEYLTLFASGKDRIDPAAELHTNFRIRGDGEYLALVAPDGLTVVDEFNPEFPTQVADIAYGIGTDVAVTQLVGNRAEVKYLIPQDDSLKEQWYRSDFNDEAWSTGQTGIGYDTGEREIDPHVETIFKLDPVGYWRFEETTGTSAANSSWRGTDLDATYEGDPVLDAAGPENPSFGLSNSNSAIIFDGTDDAVLTGQPLMNDLTEFTMTGFIKPGELTGSRLGLFGQNNVAEFGFQNPDTLRLISTSGGRVDYDYTLPKNEWHHVAAVGTGTALQIYVDGELVAAGGTPIAETYGARDNDGFNIGGGGIFSSSGNYFTGQIDEVALFHRALTAEEIASLVGHTAGDDPVFADAITTDIKTDMLDKSSSLYTRIDFDVEDPTKFNRLTLNAKYDDGIVAYLNGAEVIRANVPGETDEPLAFDATAVETRFDAIASEFEAFNLNHARDLLHAGENTLSIQLVNLGADNPDALLVPELDAAVITVNRERVGYLTTPTPNALNNPVSEKLGPVVVEIDHSPQQPTESDATFVSAEVVRTLNDVSNVELVYRVMFGEEVTLPMADDGTNGDITAGDNIYAGTIPAGVAKPGEMLRWYVRATDTVEAAGRNPKFEVRGSDNQDPEYAGTMIADASITSEIPILHWFVENEGRAGTEGGTRASLYYNGEFYDNMFVRQRGGSTRNNSLGKTNFKFDFKGSQFRFDPAYPRVEEFNINSTASDKAYVRQSMSFEAHTVLGAPASISFPMHVRRNNEFYGVFAFIEEPSAEMLAREGLDPNGALYKMRNEFTAANGNDKKTRKEEGNSDLDAFVKSIRDLGGQELTNYLFDNVDLPASLNYLVATVLIHQNDNPHKNHFIYRDSDGSGEWLFIPWDNDLTWGSNWAGSSFLDIIYADDDEITEGPVPGHDLSVIHPSHPLINTQQHREWNNHWNRLMDALLNDPTIRQMFLRRLRSGMDLFMGPPGTTDSYYDQRFDWYAEHMAEDARLDLERWGNGDGEWRWGENQTLQQAIDIIKNEYLDVRRTHLYETHNIDRVDASDFRLLVPENPVGKYFVPSDDLLGTTWTTVNFDDNSWTEGQAGFGFDDRGNLDEEINTVANPKDTVEDGTSILVRIPFTVDDPASAEKLLLRMKYDDGFVAYMNGTEIARENITGEPMYNSRPRTGSVTRFANIDISEHVNLLQPGNNVLAIHGLNRVSSSRNDMLISPMLVEGFFPTVEIAGIPHEQALNSTIQFDQASYDVNPVSGNQDEEFIKLDNPNEVAVDISDWRITGGIEHIFKPGTVIPANSSIYVSPDVRTFRARATGPGGGQGLFVQGNYEGHLSSFGETLNLISADGTAMDTLITPSNPSDVQTYLRISEVHYNPPGLEDVTEFVELVNISSGVDAKSLDLSGVTLSQGPTEPFALPRGTPLDAGQALVIVQNPAAFQLAYPNVSAGDVYGPFTGNLSNQGERIKVDDATGSTIVDFNYRDADHWPQNPDGAGGSLVLIDPASTPLDQFGKSYRWRGSTQFGGTPTQPASDSISIVINEVQTNADAQNVTNDAIELLNTSSESISVGGWFLSDSADDLLKYQIPDGTTIDAGGYLVIEESQFNPNPAAPGPKDFALNGSAGDDVWLVVGDGQGGVSQLVDDVRFGASRNGGTLGRFPNGTGRLAPMQPTLNAANGQPIAINIFINEIQYQPERPSAEAKLIFDPIDVNDLEFIEVYNPADQPADMTDWRIRGGIDFEFDADTTIGANGTLVVLPFNPESARNEKRFEAFKTHYRLDEMESIVYVGGYRGQLSNSEDRLQLQRPDTATGDGLVPALFEDEVLYDDLVPWPIGAKGTGQSIQRTDRGVIGSDPGIWTASPATPGIVFIAEPIDLNGDGALDELDIQVFCQGLQTGDTAMDLNGDGIVNNRDRDYLIHDVFQTNYGDADLNGVFDSTDIVNIFQKAEYEDGIAGNSTWSEGDWNCDGDFTSRDIVLAFQQGGYVREAVAVLNMGDVGAASASIDAHLIGDLRNDGSAQMENESEEKSEQFEVQILTAGEIDPVFLEVANRPDAVDHLFRDVSQLDETEWIDNAI